MDARAVLADLGLTGAAYAASVTGGDGAGFNAHVPVTPASLVKVQVALTVANAIATGALDATEQRVMSPVHRTPGPVGISLMRDEVSMSLGDLIVQMLTISDNVATDELIAVVGLDQVNRTTRDLGMTRTAMTSNLQDMLDTMAVEVGFDDYATLVAHDPQVAGPPSRDEVHSLLANTAALDPHRGSRTTPVETVTLLCAIWTGRAGSAPACASIRRIMAQQLTRHRIASAFPQHVAVAAKSGGLMGIVRNEAGVVTLPDGEAYAVAVFTRRAPGVTTEPALIDAGIGHVARALVDQLRQAGH